MLCFILAHAQFDLSENREGCSNARRTPKSFSEQRKYRYGVSGGTRSPHHSTAAAAPHSYVSTRYIAINSKTLMFVSPNLNTSTAVAIIGVDA